MRWQGLARIFGSLSFLQRISFHEQYVEQQRGCTGFQDGCLQEWAQATLGDGAARRQCCDLTFLAARRGTVPGGTGQTRGLEQVPVVPFSHHTWSSGTSAAKPWAKFEGGVATVAEGSQMWGYVACYAGSREI